MQLRNSRHGPFYGCTGYPDCDCTHGAHAGGLPLGVPGDRATRRARIRAHEAFDALWKPGPKRRFNRTDAYNWLKLILGCTERDAHIGSLDQETSEMVIVRAERLAKRRLPRRHRRQGGHMSVAEGACQ
jgi:hypothetical protein